MKRDKLRGYLEKVNEGYILAATPAAPRVYGLASEQAKSQDREDMEISASRARLLVVGIDVKHIVQNFLAELTEEHGCRRAERLKNYLLDGYLERFYWANRQQILADRKRLNRIISRYRKT